MTNEKLLDEMNAHADLLESVVNEMVDKGLFSESEKIPATTMINSFRDKCTSLRELCELPPAVTRQACGMCLERSNTGVCDVHGLPVVSYGCGSLCDSFRCAE